MELRTSASSAAKASLSSFSAPICSLTYSFVAVVSTSAAGGHELKLSEMKSFESANTTLTCCKVACQFTVVINVAATVCESKPRPRLSVRTGKDILLCNSYDVAAKSNLFPFCIAHCGAATSPRPSCAWTPGAPHVQKQPSTPTSASLAQPFVAVAP
eukprot:3895816-Amphidinium_carterae.1